MLKFVTGDMFKSQAQVLTNPVNCVGVMSKGLALRFKRVYPRMFRVYQTLCRRKFLVVGSPWLWSDAIGFKVLLFPTKYHWRAPSEVHYIGDGLRTFADRVRRRDYASPIGGIAMPALGCGLGGLDFESQVRPQMEMYLSDLDIDVEVYLPKG